MIKHHCKIVCIFVALIILILLSGCIDMELELSLNRDGSGKAKVIAAATEPMFNEIVDEMVRELRTEDPRAKINERYDNNRKVAEVEITFQDAAELSDHGFSVSHSRDDRKHRVDIAAADGIPMKISLRMPGRIIQSNGTSSGSTVHWETSYMGGIYWAESEEAAAGGTAFAILVITVVIAGLIIWYLVGRKTAVAVEVPTGALRAGFCSNCGSPFPPSDRFCSKCGSKRD